MIIDLKQKVAIVTGAGKGIGLTIATTLAKEGAITCLLDINEQDLINATEELQKQGCTVKNYICDVRNEEQIHTVIDDIVQNFGRIDILVNNAGVAGSAYVDEMNEELWDRNLDINLKGTFLMCKAVIPVMKKQRWGRILNASSFAAIIPLVGSSAYAASKAGVTQFTRTLAGELGPWNITVNSYAPGMIPTDINHFTELPEETQERLLDTLTLRKWGEKQDIANLICFLASDLASYITGTMVEISGGKLTTQIPRLAYDKAAGIGHNKGKQGNNTTYI